MLAGDFNMDLLHIEKDKNIEEYFDLLTNNKFMPLITIPTRITKTSKTLIDNIFYNEFTNNTISENFTVGISDHLPQFSLMPSNVRKSSSKKSNKKYSRKFNKINIDKFNEYLNKVNWWMPENETIDKYSNNFLHIFNQILDIHAPETEVKTNKNTEKRNAEP